MSRPRRRVLRTAGRAGGETAIPRDGRRRRAVRGRGLREQWTPTETQTGLGEFGGDGPDRSVEPPETFAVLTTEPNDLVAGPHHRVAVNLPEGTEREWLTAADSRHLLEPYPADSMRAYRVPTAVNAPANDSPELLESAD